MALSSCEVEYVEAYYSTCQALWLQILLEELDVFEAEKIKLLVDNKSAIYIAYRYRFYLGRVCIDFRKNNLDFSKIFEKRRS